MEQSLIRELSRVSPTTEPDKIVEIFCRDGGVIIENLIDKKQIDAINAELQPFVDARQPGFKAGFDGTFYGSNTKRLQGIATKSPSFVDAILTNPVLLSLADRVLLKNCGNYWMGQAETLFIGPGNPAQELHRDDLNWANASELGIDLQISVLTALGDYDAEVGATRIIPGSHLWPLDRPFDGEETVPVSMKPGSALVYSGRVVHGGGWNQTKDRWRRGLYCSYLLGWLTPEEASALSLTPDVAKRLPQRARELLGWSNLRGSPAEDGAAAALQLWQLDKLDIARYEGLFNQS